jgi:hypothetical protein
MQEGSGLLLPPMGCLISASQGPSAYKDYVRGCLQNYRWIVRQSRKLLKAEKAIR